MRITVLLEFGVPHYREFIFDWLRNNSKSLTIIHSNERFLTQEQDYIIKGVNIPLYNGISLNFFNPKYINNSDVIISTLNIRKPHTWLPYFFYRKKKWLFWGHGKGSSNSRIINSIRKYIINNSLGFISYTPEGKESLVDVGISSDKISVAYNTLKVDNAEMTNGNSYLLYVGRIQERKGLAKVIEVLKDTDYKFLVVGDGLYLKKLRKMTEEIDAMDRIQYVDGIYDEAKLKKYFSNAIAYISPDHVGLGVVHAFAYGVPVITNKTKTHAPEFSYCTENNSYLYTDDKQLLELIDKVFNDDNLRIQKKKNAFKFFEEYLSYENVLNAFEERLNYI